MSKIKLIKKIFVLLILLLLLSFSQKITYSASEHFFQIPISSTSNGFIWMAFPSLPLGKDVVLGNIPFNLPTKASGKKSYLDMDSSSYPLHPSEGVISTIISNPHSIYLLLASGNSFIKYNNQKIGEIIIEFKDSSTYKIDLILGQNIREWCQHSSSTVNSFTDSNVQNVWSEPCQAGGSGKLDMITINLPLEFREKILTRIIVDDTSFESAGSYDPAVNWYGLTIKNSIPPIILLPGMTACWNKGLITGSDGDSWTLPLPASLTYRNLMNTFEDIGLEKDKDWYLFCYDWRKPLSYNSEKLNDFVLTEVNIPENNRSPSDPVNLVGHSMGGLISRYFTQSYPDLVEEAVFVGSPHQGAVKTYPVWEGAQFWGYEGLEKLLIKLLLRTHRQSGEHPIKTIRRDFLSLRDLLPTFSFLVEEGTETFKPIEQHIWHNETLNFLNLNLTQPLKGQMGVIYGHSFPTLESIFVSSISAPHANWVHQTFGLWEDGEPIHTCPETLCEYTDHNKNYTSAIINSEEGDKTVLVQSAKIAGASSYNIPAEHGNLTKTDEGINGILTLLGINGSPSLTPVSLIERAIVFLARSPVKITVIAPDEKEIGFEASGPEISNSFYDEEANFVLIPNHLPGNYRVKILGTGMGNYELLLGQINEANQVEFNQYYFTTAPGKPDEYEVNFDEPQPKIINNEASLSFESAVNTLQSLENDLKHVKILKVSRKSLEKAAKYLQENNCQKFHRFLKISLILLNKAFFNLDSEALLSSFVDYESAVEKISEFYFFCDNPDYYNSHKLEKLLLSQKRKLLKLDDKFQEKSKNNQEISQATAVIFQKTVTLFQKAEEAFGQEDWLRTDFHQFQIKYLLQYLSKVGNEGLEPPTSAM